jgi:methylated-DNA-protein-cysteine methyltransferase-like protein
MDNIAEKIIQAVNQIPYGKVSSFGEVGKSIGVSGFIVGRILTSMSQDDWHKLPWQRVVNKSGYVSSLKLGYKGLLQIELLKKEGIIVVDGIVNMGKFAFEFNSSDNLFN